MAPPGAGVRSTEKQTRCQVSGVWCQLVLNDLQNGRRSFVYYRTRGERRLSVSLDTQTAHDLEKTGVVGQSQLLRRLGDVPLVALKRLHDDLALGFLLLFFKRASFVGGRASCVVRGALSHFGGHGLELQLVAVARDDHALDHIPQLTNVVAPPAASKAPLRVAVAPVKAPRSWPNSSLSTSSCGRAALLSAMKGPLGLGPSR